jgi:ABC-2 type transport system permease protein
MAGKVLGIGTVGLIQMIAIGGVGVVSGLVTGVLTISISAAVGTVLWLIVWYSLGFFMYSIVFAALGALVSRQEDVGVAVTPALMFVIAGYVIGISILPSNPGSPLVEVLSLVPMFFPTLMPMRLGDGRCSGVGSRPVRVAGDPADPDADLVRRTDRSERGDPHWREGQVTGCAEGRVTAVR